MRFYRKTENFVTLLLARLNVTFSTLASFADCGWSAATHSQQDDVAHQWSSGAESHTQDRQV